MSKDLSSNKLNSIYGDIIHFGRDLNDLFQRKEFMMVLVMKPEYQLNQDQKLM